MSWFGYQWRSSRSWSGLVTLVNGDIPVSGDASASTVVNREAVYRNGKHLQCFFALGTFMCFSRPVRWGWLDFMSAVPPPAPPPPDLNCKLLIAVVPAGPTPQAPDQSVSAGPPPQVPDQSVPCRTSIASSGSECSPPDLNHKKNPKIYQIECQKTCQKICQKIRQNRCQIECQRECQSMCQKEWLPDISRWYVRTMSEKWIRVGIARRFFFYVRKTESRSPVNHGEIPKKQRTC